MTRDVLSLALVFCVGAASAGCLMHRPHRTVAGIAGGAPEVPGRCDPVPLPPADPCGRTPQEAEPPSGFACTSIDRLTDADGDGARHRDEVACFAEERHVASATPVGLPHDGFDLHVVEFDDQGHPWSAARLEVALQRIRARLAEGPALVLTFVHGWKNNADVCNDNLACFREALEIVAKGERRFADLVNARLPGKAMAPRRVVGIYVAWRGGSIKVEPLKSVATFWGRKHAAHTIGDNGAVTNFIQAIRSAAHQRPGSSAVFVGHSFGAAVLLSAIGTSLIGDLGRAVETATSTGEPVFVQEQGDLFVLVNAALEGSRYENIFNAAMAAPDFSPDQLPVMLTMAAENDLAVGLAFPVGQSVSTWARSARNRRQWQSMIQGVGLYRPYHTHRLELKEGLEATADAGPRPPCGCKSRLRAAGDALVLQLDAIYQRIIDEGAPATRDASRPVPAHDAEVALASFREFLFSTLEPVRPVDPHVPLMTVQVDRRVIDNHGGLFNPRFLDFLVEYVVAIERKRGTLREAVRQLAVAQ